MLATFDKCENKVEEYGLTARDEKMQERGTEGKGPFVFGLSNLFFPRTLSSDCFICTVHLE